MMLSNWVLKVAMAMPMYVEAERPLDQVGIHFTGSKL